MFTQKSIRIRFWISILILLHLVAMLLPASAKPLFAQANTTTNPASPVTQNFSVSTPGGAGEQQVYLPMVAR